MAWKWRFGDVVLVKLVYHDEWVCASYGILTCCFFMALESEMWMWLSRDRRLLTSRGDLATIFNDFNGQDY
jgi:hypothetical protein